MPQQFKSNTIFYRVLKIQHNLQFLFEVALLITFLFNVFVLCYGKNVFHRNPVTNVVFITGKTRLPILQLPPGLL